MATDFKSEHELCSFFTEGARAQGWLVYPETAGFDLLLVATDKVGGPRVKEGDQVGIEAKMRGNVTVLRQALPGNRGGTAPHFFAVLVPTATWDFRQVAQRLGIAVLETWRKDVYGSGRRIMPKLALRLSTYYRYEGCDPCWTPGVQIDVSAGVSSPKSITPWKIAAVKLCLRAKRYGTITSEDFREAGISSAVFKKNGWVRAVGKVGRLLTYAIQDDAAPPHILYPEIAAAIAKEGSHL